MRDYDENIVQLIQLYLTGDLSEEEKVKLEDWIRGDSSRKRLFDEICEERNVVRDLEVYERVNKESAWEKVVCGILSCNIHLVGWGGIAGWLP